MSYFLPSDNSFTGSGGSGALGSMFGKRTVSEAVVKSVCFLNNLSFPEYVLILA